METNRKYWKGLDELHQTPEFLEGSKNEFPEDLSVNEFLADEKLAESSTGRRDFLKFLGFSVAAATLAACEAPVVKAVPYVVKPENVTPGMALWYASTYYDGSSYSSILVKTREGRPIFIKGNKDFGFCKGAINPRVNSSVLSLYDGERLQSPVIDGESTDWTSFDAKVIQGLDKASGNGEKIVLLSGTEISPSTLDVISEFKTKYGSTSVVTNEIIDNVEVLAESNTDNIEHIQYDAVSFNGIRQANLKSFGKNIIPDYDFSKAKSIVSVGADFMNSWLMSGQYTNGYIVKRNPDSEWMSKHFHFESNMSISGSNADVRGMIKPSQHVEALSILHKEIVGTSISGVKITILEGTIEKIKSAAKHLMSCKGESLLISGSNDVNLQLIVNAINQKLNNYSSTINLNNPVNMFKSEDDKMSSLIEEMNAGKIGAIVMWNTNPSYSHPNAEAFKTGLKKVNHSVAISQYADETAVLCKYVAAESHALESWNDYNPKVSHKSLSQPTIRPLFDTRSTGENLMVWAGLAESTTEENTSYHDFIKSKWENDFFTSNVNYSNFSGFWNNIVRNSCENEIFELASAWNFTNTEINVGKTPSSSSDNWEVLTYSKAGLGVGVNAGNPWLQEMPDPISKVTWDNYITMSPTDMDKHGYSKELGQESPSTVASLVVGETTIKLPVFPQPGQMPGTVGVALGYGRGSNGEKIGKSAYQTGEYGAFLEGENGGKVAIGANAYPLLKSGDFAIANISKTNKVYNLACTQTHSTVMGRNSIVKETTLEIYKAEQAEAYNHKHVLHSGWNHDEKPIEEFNLWDEHPVENVGHRWGMTIDLNACIGCGSCLIACQAENNVPVVGKDEVRRGREMHWIRLDRYYASDIEPAVGTKGKGYEEQGFAGLHEPADNPKVVHMPMFCVQCNHAPCETVCPVAATTHSNEGLNMMAYNRCIGTRYCGNNCPYKVRRFNWFNYPSYRKFSEINPAQDDLGRMVLNPDVVVRTRGVMEKCSFCIQEIQAGKLKAKKEKRPLKDGDVDCACSGACPANAIHFGDVNDVTSAVRKSSEDKRSYLPLEEIGVEPNVWFKVKVRNEHNEALSEIQKPHHQEAHHEESEHTDGEHSEDALSTGHNGGH